MRIDQYLKIARLVKRRPVSKALADQQRVLINGKAAKPAADVKIGDTVDLLLRSSPPSSQGAGTGRLHQEGPIDDPLRDPHR
jgi:ribosomal 50S subunit-recycling heat shock protein